MKKYIVLLIISLSFLSAKCQQPDTLTYYSIEYVDSIKTVHALEIAAYQELINNNNLIGNVDLSILDTTTTAKTSLRIVNGDRWYSIVQDSSRYNFWLLDNKLEVWIGEGNKSDLIIKYDLGLKTLTYLQYK